MQESGKPHFVQVSAKTADELYVVQDVWGVYFYMQKIFKMHFCYIMLLIKNDTYTTSKRAWCLQQGRGEGVIFCLQI